MNGDSFAELAVYAAAEAWADVEDEDIRHGIALLLGKILAPDTDMVYQSWLAGLVLVGIEKSW